MTIGHEARSDNKRKRYVTVKNRFVGDERKESKGGRWYGRIIEFRRSDVI